MFAQPAPIRKVTRAETARDKFSIVLAICPEQDHLRLQEIFQDKDLTIHQASTWREGSAKLKLRQPHVVICEATLPDADWKDVLNYTASLENAAKLIVMSSQADDFLWAEVLNLGGYDVLPKPLLKDEVAWVVSLACQTWRSERDRQRKPTESRSAKNREPGSENSA